ncbi:hypothetical protein V8F33_009080 [Rhypophila sp. PSN 637]
MIEALTSGQYPIFTEKEVAEQVLRIANEDLESTTMKNLETIFDLMKRKPWRFSTNPQYAKSEDRRPLLDRNLGSGPSSSSAESSVSLSPYQSDDSGSSYIPSYRVAGTDALTGRPVQNWAQYISSSEESSSGRSSRNSHGGSSGSGGSKHSHGGGSGSKTHGHGGSSGGGSSSRHKH